MGEHSDQKPRVIVRSAEEGRSFRVFNDLMTFTLTSDETQGAFSLIFDQVLPQGRVSMHSHSGQETFILFDGGNLTFRVQNRGEDEVTTFTATRGTLVHIPEYASHSYTNESERAVSMFVIFTPAGSAERFFARLGVPVPDLTNPPAWVSPDPATLLALFQEFNVRLTSPRRAEEG